MGFSLPLVEPAPDHPAKCEARATPFAERRACPEISAIRAQERRGRRRQLLLTHPADIDSSQSGNAVMTGLLRRSIPLLVLGALLSGCATAEQVAQHNEERCAARGYQPKTDGFADCLVRLDTERDTRMESRRRESLEKAYVPPTN
jgi:hypothetical protein